MKQITIFGFILLLAGTIWTGSIYDHSVPKIEGGSQPLAGWQGKKILVITLPLVQSASADSMLYSLDTLASARSATLKVIAVPSYEDGYTPAQKTQLETWYRSKLGNHVVITEGLYTRRTSGSQQHGLFKWLTVLNQNESFDIDVTGPGYKFFVSSTGQLYGVLRPHTSMWSGAVQKTVGMGE